MSAKSSKLSPASLSAFDLGATQQRMSRTAWRVVESQEVAATQAITRNAAEQSRLEQLLDAAKPPVPPDCEGLSYLLYTPFRYPPLPYGSRFGGRFERGIYYASLSVEAAFTECALYLYLFQQGPESIGPLASVRSQRSAFSARLRSGRAVDTSKAVFDGVRQKISDPASWEFSQQLGTALRAVNTGFCLYESARKAGATNVAVFDPKSFAEPAPLQIQHWHLHANLSSYRFSRRSQHGLQIIEIESRDFFVGDSVPHPALSS